MWSRAIKESVKNYIETWLREISELIKWDYVIGNKKGKRKEMSLRGVSFAGKDQSP